MKDPFSLLEERLIPDIDAELTDFIRRFAEGTVPSTESGMERHFAVAKRKPESFCNHKTVLAVSFGGSNTKIMLASMRQGQLVVEYVRGLENPAGTVAFYDYLDELLLRDETVRRYLTEEPCPEIGVSIPMMLIEDCPFHATKLPAIDGLVARSREEIGDRLRFRDNFAGYMKSRGLAERYRLFYQSDGIVAHHGAIALSDVSVRDKTVLCICGTGMANGDERHYLPVAMVNTLPEDDALFPPEETEGRQLQYAIAGKGVFGLMRRAIEERIRMGGSALEGKETERFFQSSRDSRLVFELYQDKSDADCRFAGLDELLAQAGEEGAKELRRIAEPIVIRIYETLANTIFATLLSMGTPEPGGKYVVYLEGSIARNPEVKKGIFARLRKVLAQGSNPELLEDPPLKAYVAGENCTQRQLAAVDTTLAGTASMIMAECQEE